MDRLAEAPLGIAVNINNDLTAALAAALAFSLAMTLVLEVGFFYLVGKRNKKDLLLVIMVNILTNPAVVLLYWLSALYTDINSIVAKAVLEICAVLVEGYYYKRYAQDFKKPFLFSLAANGFSYFIGVLLQLWLFI